MLKYVSKEAAKEARNELLKAAELLDKFISDTAARNSVKLHILRADGFIERTESRLPTEATYERSEDKRKERRAAQKATDKA